MLPEVTTPKQEAAASPETSVGKKGPAVSAELIHAVKAKAAALGKNAVCLLACEQGMTVTDSSFRAANGRFIFGADDMLGVETGTQLVSTP